MAKLWAKGYELDDRIEEFTVGNDYRLDRALVVADCAGSIAHARMLESIGILSSAERGDLETALRRYAALGADDAFEIRRSEEDCHTAIENRLTAELGSAGKKIHTGRSRNDQVLTALRIVERSFLLRLVPSLIGLIRSLLDIAHRHRYTPMPGRTHLQAAMPSSVGLWAAGYAEQLGDQLSMCGPVYDLIDRCPLGSAAGYGVPLPIDRALTARLLGFPQVHNNVIAVANSRGELDAWLVTLLDHIGLVLSRLAEDLMLYSLPELGYFSLPEELCSGSSIMPQKKNPDVLELIRARSATLTTYAMQLGSVVRGLPSGYNRDLQETKEPLLRGMRTGLQLVLVANRTVAGIEVHESRLAEACSPELYATDVALERVAAGTSFRDAYREVAQALANGTLDASFGDHRAALAARDHVGTASQLGLEQLSDTIDEVERAFSRRQAVVNDALSELLGASLTVYPDRARE